ncbi:MAG: site-specific integrase [Bacteroidetes bacterium]|nr:site-specific integrase [Bacteroidota bacterium]
MDIESILFEFESKLRTIGFTESMNALLVQLNIGGHNYIRSCGNLNNLTLPSIVIKNRQRYKLIEFIEEEIYNSSLSESTKLLHKNTIKLLKDYDSEIEIGELTNTRLYNLEAFMLNKGLAINTIARHMKVLKRYINMARKKELLHTYPFLGYTIKSENTHRESLTEKELELYEKYEPISAEEKEVLQAFLFSCYTGLRYSDICSITKQDISFVNRKKWVVLRMKKTKGEIRIPLAVIFDGKGLKLIKEIKRSRGILFRISSNQQANRILKAISKRVGVKRNITFHSARHTCATLLLYKGVSLTTVQKILGHQSVKTTQIYSAVTDLTIEKEIKAAQTKNRKKK